MKKRIICFFCAAVLVLLCTACNPQLDYEGPWWTQSGADPNHTGTLDTADFNVPESVAWEYSIGSDYAITTSPIVVNGYVYFSGEDGYVYCLKESNGRKVWSYPIAMAAGVIVCYFFGTIWFSIQSARSFMESLTVCVLPFIGWDCIKIVLACAIVVPVYKAVSNQFGI